MDYKDAIILAMKREKNAHDLYSRLALATEDDAGRELFLAFAKEEAMHKNRFEREYDDVVLKEN